jgi:hypothetical protein
MPPPEAPPSAPAADPRAPAAELTCDEIVFSIIFSTAEKSCGSYCTAVRMSSLIIRSTARANCASSTLDRRESRLRRFIWIAIVIAPSKITVSASARINSSSVTPARRRRPHAIANLAEFIGEAFRVDRTAMVAGSLLDKSPQLGPFKAKRFFRVVISDLTEARSHRG